MAAATPASGTSTRRGIGLAADPSASGSIGSTRMSNITGMKVDASTGAGDDDGEKSTMAQALPRREPVRAIRRHRLMDRDRVRRVW